MFRQAEDLSSEESAAAIEAYFRIVSACVAGWEDNSSSPKRSGAIWAGIASYIETHLPEVDLSPARIATAMGISVRHVHRVFSSKGCSVADWIRERRLRQCHSDLSDPHLRQKSITEIAFFWGFNDSAHFSRSFKQQYGICPRVFRSHTWARAERMNPSIQGNDILSRQNLRGLLPS